MVFGYEAVSQAFNDGAALSNGLKQLFYDDSFGASINGMDGPDHVRFRRFFQKAFLPQTVARWGKQLVPDVISGLVDSFAGRGRAELISEFTALFPFYVIYGQLRMPDHERPLFQKLAVGLTCAGIDPIHSREANVKMGDYFTLLLQERRSALENSASEVGDDLISMLAISEVDGERLPNEIAVSFLRQLMAAAGDTTYRNAGSLLTGLLTHPEQLDAVRRDRSLIPKAVEEALRWEAPITFEQRLATRDVVVDGVTIPEGSKVDVVIGSANRDPARFPNPDEFDIFRKQERQMAFAYGPHVCIGQHLARLELSNALDTLLDRLPNLRLDPDKPTPRVSGLNSRSPVALHVVFD
jgi:cytochrome P450